MRRSLIIALLLLTTSAAFAATPADDVRAAETAFAKAFADRDTKAFFAFVAPDATFLGRKGTLSGRDAVIQGWTPMVTSAKAPFRWQPERVETNAAGDLGISTGPVFDDAGNHIADYLSVWQKQKDGSWKIVFDGPGAPVCPPAAK